MSVRKPATTLLTVFVHPAQVEHVLYLIGSETLAAGGTEYTTLTKPEERIALDLAHPFTVTHREKQLVFALKSPPTTRQIEEVANLVSTGLMYGFTVVGEIDLNGKIIDNRQ